MTIEESWAELEQEAAGGGPQAILRRRVTADASRDLFIAVEKPGLQRLFLMRVARDRIPASEALPATRGVAIRTLVLPGDGDDHASLTLALKDARSSDIFTALVGDMAGRLATVESDDQAIAIFVGRLQKWQRFLAEQTPEVLSAEARRGLYGELVFLRRHVLPTLRPSGVAAWTGARRTPQDYQFPACAVEVKTSTSTQHQVLRIANERQLDDSNLQNLFLYHLSLEEKQGSGETLVDAVASLRGLLSDDARAADLFETALLDAGYLDVHAARYTASGYAIREENLFRVADGFPRIVEADLRNGVGDVAYSISVAECRHYPVPATEVAEVMARTE